KLFGTDGIRGKANTYPITPEVALQVGKAVARVFKAKGRGYSRAVVGKDTRLSGYMLENALASGLVSMGMDVYSVGPMPTPAVAHLTKSFCATCGIMITASHNPSDDNGIKIFDANGFKLPDEVENDIESHVLGGEIDSTHIGTEFLGKAFRIDDARGRYIEFAKASIRNHSLKGLKIVLDCAHGAGYFISPIIFRELGAEVIKSSTEPDGFNINLNCGATCPQNISKLVLQHKADVGIALDGDGDRVIFCDARGKVVNGDRILGLCALDYKERGRLAKNTIVVTSMSNLGLSRAMEKNGINVVITDVGDRYVVERMRSDGYNIGGEQSGHVIFMDYVTTGDGTITALHVLKLMMDKKKSLAELADFMEEFPQILSSFNVKEKKPIDKVPNLVNIVAECEKYLGSNGRVILRYSGTENKIRLLIEALNQKDVEIWTAKIKSVIEKELS
ncbi:MAG: phosphoglucosamine mutase, partial [Lentisphaerota bacterium]